ncbi:MAG: urea carboxylase-associated family protein [Solirubrobacterales bacterium]
MTRESLLEVVVPAREARLVEVEAGQVLAVVDLEGRQVGDLAAWVREDPAEYLSPGHTLSCLTKLVPEAGDEVFSNRRTPLLRILRDDVGRHDLIVPCCDPERYSRDYGLADHPSCLASLQAALAADGRRLPLHGEQCWNVFMNNVHEDGRIVTHEPEHAAGARIELEALVDLVVALSACPQDLSPCNAFDPTPMALRVYGAN